jgi:CheY-like chemotaxis protein
MHILIIEDNATTREALTTLLEGVGYGVTGAANGREALDYTSRGQD